jgi:hypothetical protein
VFRPFQGRGADRGGLQEAKLMKTAEIIAGLKDLISDRESFIEGEADHDNVFIRDKAVLQAAIEKLQKFEARED